MLDPDLIASSIYKDNEAFQSFFDNKKRYEVLYGGAGSGKSHKIARKILVRCLLKKHNYLVCRKVGRTLKKSVFTLIKNILSGWCSNEGLKLSDVVEINKTDLTFKFLHNESQIMLSGMDDPEKIKSIEGVTSIWLEEVTEFNQDDFEQLDLRLRGEHEGIHKQVTVSFNPVSAESWVKKVFFDSNLDDVFLLHTTYLNNRHIGEEYKQVLENKKITNPRYYKIYALGEWGTAEGLVFNRVTQRSINIDEIKHLKYNQGLDFGYTNDPTAFNCNYVDFDNMVIYVTDGFYEKGLSNTDISNRIKELKRHRSVTICDSSEPKSIDSLRGKGLRVQGALKGKDSINAGVAFLQEFEIVVNSHLNDFMKEFLNYSWQIDKNGRTINKPVDDFNHFIDSLRYSVEKYSLKKSDNQFKILG